MTDKERVEKFKSHELVINCRTENEAEKFIDWCYENGIKWDDNSLKYNNWFGSDTCYRFFEDDTLAYSDYLDYLNKGYKRNKIITYQEFFKEDEMTNIDYLIENKDKFEIIDGCYFCKVVYELKNKSRCINHCSSCEFNKSIDVLKYLAEKHNDKIKVTQFEYDLLNSLELPKDLYEYVPMCNFKMFIGMKEKGYFKNVNSKMTVKEILNNCEITNE